MNKEYQTPSEPSWKEIVAYIWAWLRFAFQTKQPAQQPAIDPAPVNPALDAVLTAYLDGGVDVVALVIAESEQHHPRLFAGLSDAVLCGDLTHRLIVENNTLRVEMIKAKTKKKVITLLEFGFTPEAKRD
jgi:hypothetical protein